jgi:hypothetical protein
MRSHVDERGELTTFFNSDAITGFQKIIMPNKNVLAQHQILRMINKGCVGNARMLNAFTLIVINALIHSRSKRQEKAP